MHLMRNSASRKTEGTARGATVFVLPSRFGLQLLWRRTWTTAVNIPGRLGKSRWGAYLLSFCFSVTALSLLSFT